MIHYLKADFYKIIKERKLTVSFGILILLSLLSAFLLKDNPTADNTSSLLQLLSQFITLFFIVPTNLFFGEDFTNRTINNIIIKKKQRHSLFCYKTLATILLNLSYVLIAYLLSSIFRVLLHGQLDGPLILKTFLYQLPLLICISFIAILIFVGINRIGTAYLTYILLNLLLDNVNRLIISNILHLDISSDYFLFASLQKCDQITLVTITLSYIALLIYLIISFSIFNHKELK